MEEMRITAGAGLLAIVCLVLLSPCLAGQSREQEAQIMGREDVLRIFRQAIASNEECKKRPLAGTPEDIEKAARARRQFHDDALEPARDACVQLLVAGRDVSLAVEFLHLLISFEGSADESFTWAVGEVYARNPELIEEAIGLIASSARTVLFEEISLGLYYYYHDKATHPDRRDRLDRLARVRCRYLQ
jgi:hypothetical protein